MKKTLLISSILITTIYAASNDEILKLYSHMPNGVSVKIIDRQPIKDNDLKDYYAVTLEFSKGNLKQKDIVFTKGDALFPDIVNVKTGQSYKDSLQRMSMLKDFSKIFKSENPKNIIKLGNDPKKETLIIITDADCPFCRREMSQVEERLKNFNLELIMSSVHGRDGDVKSYLIYKDMAKAKTDKDKLAIFKKYYDPNFKPDVNVTDEELKPILELAHKYQSAGVDGVPFIINKKELK